MSISGIGGGLDALSALLGAKKTDSTGASDFFKDLGGDASSSAGDLKKSAEDQFLDYAKMSDAEKLRAQMLEDNDLTEEKLAEMDARDRAKVEEQIREKIEKQVQQQTGKSVGGLANLLA